MTTDQISDLIKFFMVIVGFVAVSVKGFDYLKDKEQKKLDRDIALAKENSAGQEAILGLRQDDAAIRTDINKLKEKEYSQDDKIEDLEKHYDNLINRVWDFFRDR